MDHNEHFYILKFEEKNNFCTNHFCTNHFCKNYFYTNHFDKNCKNNVDKNISNNENVKNNNYIINLHPEVKTTNIYKEFIALHIN